jgi:hypothetical protein
MKIGLVLRNFYILVNYVIVIQMKMVQLTQQKERLNV